MSAKTGIEWTDATWNPVVGCERVSPGCAHCYAKALHDQRHTAHIAGKQVAAQYAEPFEVVQLKPERLTHPLSWREPRRVFVNSVSDLFHDDVPYEFIVSVFAVMALADRHTFQVLTKRPERMLDLLTTPTFVDHMVVEAEQFWTRSRFGSGFDKPEDWNTFTVEENWPLSNVWLGVSVENQRWADERIPLLLRTPAAVRFLSCEPLLGPLDLHWLGEPHTQLMHDQRAADVVRQWHASGFRRYDCGIEWVIGGAESGNGARPMDHAWIRSLRDQCVAGGVKFMWKQDATPNGRKISLPVLDGRQWTEMPEREGAHV